MDNEQMLSPSTSIHQQENAIAGPSRSRPSSPRPSPAEPLANLHSADWNTLFLSPPEPTLPPAYLKSTEDLLARFQLVTAYDKYVKPFYSSLPDHAATPGPNDKGKGKEKELAMSPVAQTPQDGGDADDDEGGGGKGDKKAKNNYKHLIKGIPGKHSMKKDDYLTTIMQVPPKQRIKITPFDLKTQREAFSVSLEGLKGWNINALVVESAQAREDRKKRKELKKLAKAQPPPLTPSIPPSTPQSLIPKVQTPAAQPLSASTPAPTPSTPTIRTSTPKPAIPRPGSRPVLPPVQVSGAGFAGNGGNVNGASRGTPTPVSAVAPGGGFQGTDKRGTKREWDGSGAGANANASNANGSVKVVANGNGNGNMTVNENGNGAAKVPAAVLSAKAGVAGVRPRPIKKQKVDMQGGARDVSGVPIQQPTPQGV